MHNQRIQRYRLLCVLFLSLTLYSPFDATATGLTDTAMPAETSRPYTIKPGDTLWNIAAAHGITLQTLLALNSNLGDPTLLRPGQTVRVPGHPVKTAASPAPVSATYTVRPDDTLWDMALDLLNRINEKRLADGRAALTWNAELAAAAQAHADDCAGRNRGSHVGSDGARLAARLLRAGYVPTWSGENWANAQSVEHALGMWWNEPPGADPHVQNIMANRATEIGIGVARGSWGIYFVADFGNQ